MQIKFWNFYVIVYGCVATVYCGIIGKLITSTIIYWQTIGEIKTLSGMGQLGFLTFANCQSGCWLCLSLMLKQRVFSMVRKITRGYCSHSADGASVLGFHANGMLSALSWTPGLPFFIFYSGLQSSPLFYIKELNYLVVFVSQLWSARCNCPYLFLVMCMRLRRMTCSQTIIATSKKLCSHCILSVSTESLEGWIFYPEYMCKSSLKIRCVVLYWT